MGLSNQHKFEQSIYNRIMDLARCGIPQCLIAQIIDLDEDTMLKYYKRAVVLAQPEIVEKIGRTVIQQAIAGNEKSQALYLKTQGAKFGWVEKQVVEQVDNTETSELKDKIQALEDKASKDY